jgi:hypothetical protein
MPPQMMCRLRGIPSLSWMEASSTPSAPSVASGFLHLLISILESTATISTRTKLQHSPTTHGGDHAYQEKSAAKEGMGSSSTKKLNAKEICTMVHCISKLAIAAPSANALIVTDSNIGMTNGCAASAVASRKCVGKSYKPKALLLVEVRQRLFLN